VHLSLELSGWEVFAVALCGARHFKLPEGKIFGEPDGSRSDQGKLQCAESAKARCQLPHGSSPLLHRYRVNQKKCLKNKTNVVEIQSKVLNARSFLKITFAIFRDFVGELFFFFRLILAGISKLQNNPHPADAAHPGS
jgi:hypothetical protein